MDIGNKITSWLKEISADGLVYEPPDGCDDKPCLCEWSYIFGCEGKPDTTVGVLACQPMKVLHRNDREEPTEWEIIK